MSPVRGGQQLLPASLAQGLVKAAQVGQRKAVAIGPPAGLQDRFQVHPRGAQAVVLIALLQGEHDRLGHAGVGLPSGKAEVPPQIWFTGQLDDAAVDDQHIRALPLHRCTHIGRTRDIADHRAGLQVTSLDQPFVAAGGADYNGSPPERFLYRGGNLDGAAPAGGGAGIICKFGSGRLR